MRTDRVARLVPAAPDWVYEALVDPALLSQWLPPQGARAVIEAFDPRPGGAIAMALIFRKGVTGKSSANTDIVKGRFVDLVKPRHVSQIFHFDSPDPEFSGEMTMTWDLIPQEFGTLVCVTAENVPPGISAVDHEAGIASSLDNLTALARAR
jgi:uncharacterized protein YndB with AHSA1/START domain